MDKCFKLGATLIARYADMVPAITFTGLATDKRLPRAALVAIGFVPYYFTRFSELVTRSLGAATKSGGHGMIAAAFGQERQGQKRFIMHRIEVHGFVETVFGPLTIAPAWQIIPIK